MYTNGVTCIQVEYLYGEKKQVLKVLLLAICLNGKQFQSTNRLKNHLYWQLYLIYTLPPRPYQVQAASFLYPQGMWNP